MLLDERAGGIADDGGLARKLQRATHPSAVRPPAVLILVSAFHMERTLALAGAFLADAVLCKPTTPSCLLDAIISLERGRRAVVAGGAVPAPDAEQALHAIRGASVLLVEDNAVNQQVASEMLARAGMRVTVASNGIEAIERVNAERFDLVLMDVQMPVMGGLQATRLLRRLAECATLPVVAMTASALPQDREDGLDAGMNAHLAKPIDPAELHAVLVAWVPRGPYAGVAAALLPAGGDAEALSRRLPTVDVARALDRLGGRIELYRKMLATYVEAHRDDADRALQRLESGDVDGLARLAHTLAGSASMLGIDDVARVARSFSRDAAGLGGDQLAHRVRALVGAQVRAMEVPARVVAASARAVRGARVCRPTQEPRAEADRVAGGRPSRHGWRG